ncbi:MAG: helix-turn-helix domain-containing protein [Brevundimonas sp.]|uniref:helix-turn-helix domain-containing protein n=1 Tax=Brevundimonas sp. TaxID=1871086 RepID=UPI0028D49FD4|nr:helix-turn-helix domain-containing protein [uncultured Brevundimonas sp.]
MNDAVDPVDIAIGGRIRARREELRITQAQLAAGAGVTFQQIQKYERGVNRVSAARLLQIASVLKSTGAALLGELETAEGDELALAAPGVAELLAAFRAIQDPAQRDALLVVAKGLRG